MRLNIWITLLLTSFVLTPVTAQVKSVLWIGNSYTATNNLPNLVVQLALSGGDTIVFDNNTPGGYTLEDHWNSLTTQYKINQQPWDYVILQAQSQEPSLDSFFVTNWVLPYADGLDSLIHLNDSCTQTIFYMTWGRKNGDAQNCAAFPPVCTYHGMQDKLTERYLQMGHDNDAIVAPCGEAWRDVIATSPTFDLYMADESHPSLYGSYLNACVFYATIYRRSPVGLTYYGGLPAASAQFLQQMAADCVLDSMPLWNTEVYYDTAGFNATLLSGLTWTFTGMSGTNHQWNTGSGFSTGSASITYTFPAPGTYTITHVTENECRTDTATITLTVGPQGIIEQENHSLTVSWSTAQDELAVINPFAEHEAVTVEIIDLQGRVVATEQGTGNILHVSTVGLAPGIYTSRVVQNEKIAAQKFAVMR